MKNSHLNSLQESRLLLKRYAQEIKQAKDDIERAKEIALENEKEAYAILTRIHNKKVVLEKDCHQKRIQALAGIDAGEIAQFYKTLTVRWLSVGIFCIISCFVLVYRFLVSEDIEVLIGLLVTSGMFVFSIKECIFLRGSCKLK